MPTLKIPRPSITATFVPESAKAEERTVEMIFYSGATIPRYSWDRGEYMLTLSTEPGAVRLDRLKSGRAPLLNAHDNYSADNVLGVIETAWVEDGAGKARAKFAKDDQAADRVWNKVKQGILRNVSMGLVILRMKELESKKDEPKHFLATDWQPQEISIVAIGADPQASLFGEQREQFQEVEVEEFAIAARATSPEENPMDKETIVDAGEQARADKQEQPVVVVADEQLNAAHKVGVTAEQGRITGILKVAKVCGLELDFAQKHIAANTSLENFRAVAIDEQALRASKQEIRHVHSDILHDEADKRRCNMTGALLERFEPNKWSWDDRDSKFLFHRGGGQRIFDGARNYAACTLLDIAKECLAVQGIRWQSKNRTEIAQLAFQSTSDFPFILADVANKSLRAGYEQVESQWRLLASRRTAADFKTVKELTLDSSSRLEKVPESGEFKHGSLVEGKESWGLSTYGKIISITRQAIINDDLGAFTRTPQLLGQEVAMLEADTVYGIVTANGAMRDTFALFATQHSNIATTPAVINVDNLSIMRVMLMTQTSTGGKVLGVQPKYLLAPAAISQVAEQYCSSNFVAATSANINPLAGKLVPIIEGRLDAADANAWYLFADPNTPNSTVLIYAYLEGQEGPYTETRNGFDVDGTEIKIRHDFAAAAIDWRGAVYNAGA